MAFIICDDLYATGIESIDEQHKHLISLLNRMFEALFQKKGKDKLAYVIDEMKKYAVYHFSTEESLMEKAGFTGLTDHCAFHELFTSKVNDFSEKFDLQDEALTAEVTIFLTNWINEHLSMVDQQYVPALKNAGIT
ncbi:MAG: hemerythrin family protein [Methanomicrobiales archaeon]|nr:hemerythrin family protein [Methanomicrobiales archaeon]